MNKKLWLSGVVFGLGISAAASESFGQSYGQYNPQGLAPNSYRNTPLRYQPGGAYNAQQMGRVPAQMTSGPIRVGGTVPRIAQNPYPEHVHVPAPINGETAQSLVPSLPSPMQGGQMQPQTYQQGIAPSYTAPLPPVAGSTNTFPQQSAPMYGVAPLSQYAPSPDPNTSGMMPIPSSGGYGPTGPVMGEYAGSSCSSCSQGADYGSAYGGSYFGSSCGAPVYAPVATGPSPWIVGANALLFRRLNEDKYRFTSDSNMPTDYLLSLNDANSKTLAGVEVFGGRYFGCGRYAIVGSYWGLFPDDQVAFANTAPGVNLRSNIPFTVRGPGAASVPYGLDMPPTNTPVYDYYDGAVQHRLVRGQNYHNAEINLFGFGLGSAARGAYADCGTSACGRGAGWANGRYGRSGYSGHFGNRYGGCGSSCGSSCGGCGDCGVADTCGGGCGSSCGSSCGSFLGPTGACAPVIGAQCSPFRFAMSGGVRWFRFRDDLEYASSRTDTIYGPTLDDFYYRNKVTNDLVGFQLGGIATYCTGRRLSLYSGIKFGVYGNHMTNESFAGSGPNPAMVLSTGANNDMPYSFKASKTGVATLGELNTGLGIRVSRGWTANVGYRLIGVTGVATAPGQIPYDFSLLNDARTIRHDDSLILHGISIGGMYNW